ncbi:hypothetical protein [Pyrobaculum sp.]|uniref:hypothetical protein n=1 Tax=Pyrobaculum sp. TaxID=2004705 RepID=UPI00316403C3
MKFLEIVFRGCGKLPHDAVFHLGFKIANGKISHAVYTPRGVVYVSSKCEECIVYRVLEKGHVYRIKIREGLVYVITEEKKAVVKLLRENRERVLAYRPVPVKRIVVTPLQREVLAKMADGGNLSTTARARGVSKVAVYKTFKLALRKVVELV